MPAARAPTCYMSAIEHPTVGDRAHVAKKEKKMNFTQGKKREDVGRKRRVAQLYVPKQISPNGT
ncbi:hypothetical protein QUA62_16360 [Microcoleus sp. MON1_C1]|uniref:hypothetical protein n=1 Tax=Microcoleus sp. MON1_C1 TaxID=2818827 RepID=UPI002FD70424